MIYLNVSAGISKTGNILQPSVSRNFSSERSGCEKIYPLLVINGQRIRALKMFKEKIVKP